MSRLYLRRRKNRTTSGSEISLTPLIDTALTLLIIFMVATPMMHNSLKIDLPEGTSKEATQQTSELVVYVTDQGALFLNDVPVSEDNLIPAIQQVMKTSEKAKPLFVKADKLVQYGKVIGLVERLKMVGGIEYVALATKQPKAA